MYKTVILHQTDYNTLNILAQNHNISKSKLLSQIINDYKEKHTQSHNTFGELTKDIVKDFGKIAKKHNIKIDYNNFDELFADMDY